jgi:hypothetical protein
MAEVTVINMLTWMGVSVAGNRQVIIADLLPAPEGIGNLKDETADGIKDACEAYSKRGPENQRFVVTRTTLKRITALMHWVKDRHRLAENTAFVAADTTRASFILELEAAANRALYRKDQKKLGESMVNKDFQVQLKSRAQWERWSVDLETTLHSIIGTQGVPLSYIIRENDNPVLDGLATWETKAISGAPVIGVAFKQDAATAHRLIVNNISEDSDAYTYIKPMLRHEDGRRDIKALRARYLNTSTRQETINEANQVLDNLTYRNERSMTFEKFSSKLQNALNDLADCGRPVHDGDIVDKLWGRIQNSDLATYVAALKIEYTRNPRDYGEILQDIATQIPSLPKHVSFRSKVSELGTNDGHTREGPCPDTGVKNKDGQLFIGNYVGNKWHSESVKPFHDDIRAARTEHGGAGGNHPSRSDKKGANQISRNKRKVSQLQAKISELQTKVDEARSEDSPNDADQEDAGESEDDKSDNQAGTAFGGKSSMKKKKKGG